MDYTLGRGKVNTICGSCYRRGSEGLVRHYTTRKGTYCPRCDSQMISAAPSNKKPRVHYTIAAIKIVARAKVKGPTMPEGMVIRDFTPSR